MSARGLTDATLDLGALFAPLARYRSIGLAVSGGPDSLALMLLVQRWNSAAAAPARLVVYTVDHRLRPEAASEAAFVAADAGKLGLAARVLAWVGDKPSAGIQEAARRARYRLIGEAMAADGVEVLVTAHHRDDQAETVLMRLAHGSGIEGLGGMAPLSTVEGVAIRRPLLGVGREALHDVVMAAGLAPVADPGNADLHYERVRWRKAMPDLARLGLDAERLARFAARMADADAALGATTDAAFAAAVTIDADRTARLDRARLAALPRAIGIRLVARVLALVGDDRKSRALAPVEALYDGLVAETAFRGRTLHGCMVRRGRIAITVAPEPGRAAKAARISAREVFET